LPGGTEVNHDKTSITISGDLAEIWSELLSSTSLEC
jgi:hypothetical protein